MIGEDANVLEAEVNQNLRSNAAFVLDHTLARGFAIELTALMKMNLRQRAGLLGRIHGETAAGVMKVKECAAIFSGDGFQRERNEFVAITGRGTKNVAREAVGVNAHKRGRIAFQVAANESNVLVVVHIARVSNHFEFAEARWQDRFRDAADVAFVLHAVANQVRHRQHFDLMLLAEFDELRHARHGAVFVHDFADDTSRVEASDAREVYGGFGLTGANENAAIAGAQRKSVAGTGEVLWLGFRLDSGKDSDGAVGSADAGGDTNARVNRLGESGAVDRSVDG